MTLRDAGYVEGQMKPEGGPGVTFTHLRVTGRGHQALGEWPLFDEIASPETLALLLERFADEAETSEEEANLRRAAGYIRGVSATALRAAAVGSLAQLARFAAGLG